MSRESRLYVVFCTALITGGLAGCTPPAQNGGDGSLNGGDALSEGRIAPKSEDIQTLKQATDRYLALCATQSAMAARVALIDELNNSTPGVASAGLANDNYTIVLAFEDGAHAAINTIEGFGAGTAYDPAPMAAKLAGSAKGIASAKAVGGPAAAVLTAKISPEPGDLRHVPTSRKILFMSAASEDLGGADVDLFDSLQTKLVIENNWATSDITVKTNRPDDDYATLGFGDFFNLESYGVIVILAHGLYMDVTRPLSSEGTTETPVDELPAGADPFNFGFKGIRTAAAAHRVPHFYIQVAAAGPLVAGTGPGTSLPTGADPFGFGFKRIVRNATMGGIDIASETARGRLLIVSHAFKAASGTRPYYYMRDDLWKEHIATLPNSLVYIGSPNGYADPDALWPDVSGSAGPGGTSPVPAGADPFNFGFKAIRSFKSMGSGAGQVFEGKNPGTLLAWTGAVDTQTALDAAGMIGLMAGRNESDREVWNSGDVARAAARAGVPRGTGTSPPTPDPADPYGFGFKAVRTSTMAAIDSDGFAKLALHSKTEDAFLYLPTWADIEVLNPLPDGTTTVTGKIEYEDASITPPDPNTFAGAPSQTYQFERLIAGQKVTVTAQALDGAGSVLGGFEQELTLQAGGNPIEVAFTRELSVTLSGNPLWDGSWGNRTDLSNPHNIHCTGFKLLVRKNGTLLSPNYIRLTDRFTSHTYPPMHLVSHDRILTYSGWNPAYPGDVFTFELYADPNEGTSAVIGPMFLHYWNDYVHEIIEIGVVSGIEGVQNIRTVTLGK